MEMIEWKGGSIMEKIIDYIEIKIVEQCNMNCIACSNFGNIARSEEYGISEYEKDLKKISDLGISIKKIRLLGGEPLLSKNILKYIELTRKYQSKSNIYVVTNGTLLQNMDETFFDKIKENDICIQISSYITKRTELKTSIKKLDTLNIKYQEYKPDFFEVDYNFEGNHETKYIFQRCRNIYDCTTLHHGRIYKCSKPISLKHYDKKYNTKYYNVNDGIDIYNNNFTYDKLIEFLNIPSETCKYCTLFKNYIPWFESLNVQFSNWINDCSNKLLIANMNEDSKVYKQNLKYFNFMTISICNKNIKLVSMNLLDIISFSKNVYLYLLDFRAIERMEFVTKILSKHNMEIQSYLFSKEIYSDFSFFTSIYDPKIESLDLNGLSDGIIILFSASDRLLMKKTRKIIKEKKI